MTFAFTLLAALSWDAEYDGFVHFRNWDGMAKAETTAAGPSSFRQSLRLLQRLQEAMVKAHTMTA